MNKDTIIIMEQNQDRKKVEALLSKMNQNQQQKLLRQQVDKMNSKELDAFLQQLQQENTIPSKSENHYQGLDTFINDGLAAIKSKEKKILSTYNQAYTEENGLDRYFFMDPTGIGLIIDLAVTKADDTIKTKDAKSGIRFSNDLLDLTIPVAGPYKDDGLLAFSIFDLHEYHLAFFDKKDFITDYIYFGCKKMSFEGRRNLFYRLFARAYISDIYTIVSSWNYNSPADVNEPLQFFIEYLSNKSGLIVEQYYSLAKATLEKRGRHTYY